VRDIIGTYYERYSITNRCQVDQHYGERKAACLEISLVYN
jgi:hypothetical protein